MLKTIDYRRSRSYWLAELGRARRWRALPHSQQDRILASCSPFPGGAGIQSSVDECRKRLADLRRMMQRGDFAA